MASTEERTCRGGGRPEDGPAVNALAGFLPSHDMVAVQRLRLLAEAVIEECGRVRWFVYRVTHERT